MILPQTDSTLLDQLLESPKEFFDRGRSYDLLQEYFEGRDVESLRELLCHDDVFVRRVAAWITSELGSRGCGLLSDVIALLKSGDRYLSYHALEIITVCARGSNAREFSRVLQHFEHADSVLNQLAMRLTARADTSQWIAAREEGRLSASHRIGLDSLIEAGSSGANAIDRLLSSSDSIQRKYGAIVCRVLSKQAPAVLDKAYACNDDDVQEFLKQQ